MGQPWYRDISKVTISVINKDGVVLPSHEIPPTLFMYKDHVRHFRNKFNKGCVITITVSDPNMHAMNFSGEYRFRYTEDKEFLIISEFETRLMNWRAFTTFIDNVESFFMEVFQ